MNGLYEGQQGGEMYANKGHLMPTKKLFAMLNFSDGLVAGWPVGSETCFKEMLCTINLQISTFMFLASFLGHNFSLNFLSNWNKNFILLLPISNN